MQRRFLTLGFVAAASALAACGEQAADPAGASTAWEHPRTAWGDPDLQGMWPIDYINGTPLQRPEAFGERRFLTDDEFAERAERLAGLNARYDDEIETNKMGMGHWAEMGEPNRLTSLVVEPANGRLPPLTEAGERKSATMRSSWSEPPLFDSIADFNALDRCITRGLPASMFPFMYNSGIQIIQAPGYVVIRLEMIHEARIVPIDGRRKLDPAIKQWMGESRGHWEGNTLVVETTNFNGIGGMTNVGIPGSPRGNTPTSEQMKITERFERVDDDTIQYSMTVEDPEVLTQSWTARYPMQRDDSYQFFEYACTEDNTAIRNFIETSRYERAQAAEAAR
jgi:hypothetical protein